MIDCPQLDELGTGARRPPHIAAHLATCPGCALVAGVLDRPPATGDDCARFEPLIAAHASAALTTTGRNLLARHLASCEPCRELAAAVIDSQGPTRSASPGAGHSVADAELDPSSDQRALPEVDPAAYAVGLEVARGGMGRILAARDLRIGRAVAIKELLHPHQQPHLAARFEREARITARLQHPAIVPIYEIGRWPDGTPFYTMRLVTGGTLREAIERAATLADRVALLPAVIAACGAVAFAHEHRVVHRDLTPSNILVGAFGETVVIDWGLAKDGDVDDLAIAGAVLGTAAYMPPEQARGAEVDSRADVYALGAILYHVLAGRAPDFECTRAELIEAVKTRAPIPLAEIEPRAPRDLASIVAKAMARDADKRYPSARELAEELRRFQTGRMVEAHAYSRRERARRYARRHRAALAIATAATVILGVVAIVSVTRVLRSRGEALETVRFVLEEQGRAASLDNDPPRALAYLDAAYAQGARSPTLGFLYETALRGLATDEATYDCGEGAAHDLVFSADGRDVAVGCHDVAKIWHLGTAGDPITLPHHAGGYDGLAYTHDGKAIATWGVDGIARLWDTRTGEPRGELAHGAPIMFTSFTPDDARVLTSGGDGDVKLWDRASPAAPRRTIEVTRALLRQVYGVLSRDGKTILTTTITGDGRGWDAETGELRGGFEHGSWVLGGDVAPAGPDRVVSCGLDKLVKLWDGKTGAPLRTLAGHSDVVFKCTFSPDGTRVLSTSHDGTARVWDADTGTLIASAQAGDSIWTGHFSPDGRRFLTVDLGGYLRVWDAQTGLLLATHDNLGGKEARFSPDNARIVALRGDGRITVWSNTAGALRASFVPRGAVLALGAGGTRAVVRDPDDERLVLWDTATGARLPHGALAEPIAVGDGALVAGGEVVDLVTGATLGMLPVAGNQRAAISADGARVAFGFADRVEVWDVEAAAMLARYPGAREAKLDAHGDRAALVLADGGIEIGESGRTVAVPDSAGARVVGFAGATLVVESAPHGETRDVTAYTAGGVVIRTVRESISTLLDPTGTFVTTIGADRVVQIWRAADGETIGTFVGGAKLFAAQADPTGELVVAISEHGAAALVLAARDGRVLARWPIEHAAPIITEGEIIPAHAEARWSLDGAAISTLGTTVSLWHAATAVTAEDRARATQQLPWRVVDGRVQLVRAALRGVVRRGGTPLAGAEVTVAIRRPRDDAGGAYTWDTIHSEVRRSTVTTDEHGAFALADLAPGEYAVTALGHTELVTAGAAAREVAIDVP